MQCKKPCPLYPNSDREGGLPRTVMSALPPKADMCGARAHVRYGPIADMRAHRRDGNLRQSQEKTSANRQFGYSRRWIFQRPGRTFGDRPTKVLCLLTKGFQL